MCRVEAANSKCAISNHVSLTAVPRQHDVTVDRPKAVPPACSCPKRDNGQITYRRYSEDALRSSISTFLRRRP